MSALLGPRFQAPGDLDQTAQYACSTLRGFVGKNSTAIVTSWKRLTKNFTFLQLKYDLDASHKGVLDRSNGLWRIVGGIGETEEQCVLAVTDDGNDSNRPNHVRRHIDIGIFVVRLCPIAATRIDVESENGLISASFQSLVNTADLGAVRILEIED